MTAPQIKAVFAKIVATATAGSPTHDHLRWTNLTVAKFVQAFAAHGLSTSRFMVR